MIVAIASGKGGTGKTTVATSLAFALHKNNQQIELLDCDVEEPNDHIFVKPTFENNMEVYAPIPQFNYDLCDLCGICVEICESNALAALGDKILLFPELCNGCGGCSKLCPKEAITEIKRPIGKLSIGQSSVGYEFIEGRINVGETSPVPLIKAIKKLVQRERETKTIIIDSPPGTTCPVIAAIDEVDFVVLVTEPTPFGLNDLELAIEMLKSKRLPFAVVINRADIGDERVVEYCKREKIEILLEIPDDRRIAESYSRGKTPAETSKEHELRFYELAQKIRNSVNQSLGKQVLK